MLSTEQYDFSDKSEQKFLRFSDSFAAEILSGNEILRNFLIQTPPHSKDTFFNYSVQIGNEKSPMGRTQNQFADNISYPLPVPPPRKRRTRIKSTNIRTGRKQDDMSNVNLLPMSIHEKPNCFTLPIELKNSCEDSIKVGFPQEPRSSPNNLLFGRSISVPASYNSYSAHVGTRIPCLLAHEAALASGLGIEDSDDEVFMRNESKLINGHSAIMNGKSKIVHEKGQKMFNFLHRQSNSVEMETNRDRKGEKKLQRLTFGGPYDQKDNNEDCQRFSQSKPRGRGGRKNPLLAFIRRSRSVPSIFHFMHTT